MSHSAIILSSAAPRIWNSLPLNLRFLSLYHKIKISSQNLTYVTGFQGLILLCLFFFVLFCFVLFVVGFNCALNTQQGGYVRITSLIIIISMELLLISVMFPFSDF